MKPAPINTVLETTAFNPAARSNPYPLLAAVQSDCPVFRDEFTKSWFVSRYEDVRTVINDRTLRRSPHLAEDGAFLRRVLDRPDGLTESFAKSGWLQILDDPEHGRIRQPLSAALNRRVARMRPSIDAVVAEAMSAVTGETFDLMAELAIPIPILAVARIIGIDLDRLQQFRAWSEAAFLVLQPIRSEDETRRMVAAQNGLDAYFLELIAARRASPADDLITDMVQAQANGSEISDTDISINLGGLLIAGNLTTSDLIASGMWLLLTHPDELAKVRADLDLVSAALEETLRFEPPIDITGRVLTEAREIGGCPMTRSQVVMTSLRAANRDPAMFDAPHEFRIGRGQNPHVAFGGGAHHCVGAPLARIVAQSAVRRILQQYPHIGLVDDQPTWRALPFFRGLQHLRVDVRQPYADFHPATRASRSNKP